MPDNSGILMSSKRTSYVSFFSFSRASKASSVESQTSISFLSAKTFVSALRASGSSSTISTRMALPLSFLSAQNRFGCRGLLPGSERRQRQCGGGDVLLRHRERKRRFVGVQILQSSRRIFQSEAHPSLALSAHAVLDLQFEGSFRAPRDNLNPASVAAARDPMQHGIFHQRLQNHLWNKRFFGSRTNIPAHLQPRP